MSNLDILQKLAGDQHDDQRCRYHWISVSNQAIITIGDSYTYGILEPRDGPDHYGETISKKLGIDWINADHRGCSNSWSINILSQIVEWLNQSKYINGSVVITLTENGRDIIEGRARQFDYSIYKDVPINLDFFHLVLNDVENEWVYRLSDIRDRLDKRFKIIIGNNFCWHQKLFEKLHTVSEIKCLPRTWIECIPGPDKIPRIRTTNTSWPQALIDIFRQGNYKNSLLEPHVLKDWLLEVQPDIAKLSKSLAERQNYFCTYEKGHPNALGHAIWADEIIAEL
jgi:hypothetical protein